MILYPNFMGAIADTATALKTRSQLVHTDKWQGVDISKKPEMATHELLHHSLHVRLNGIEDLETYRLDIEPNLPWADDHFLERVGGAPINPGVEWANWPYGNSAKAFLDGTGQFNHNYMERYWPKYAGLYVGGPTRTPDDWRSAATHFQPEANPRKGVRYNYGDLNDVVSLMARDPLTRQAFLPVWFPEDTGGNNGRAPCTLGYHFIMRDGELDVTYYIRSCDYVRHFRDDIYLTVRLLLWVLDKLRHDDESRAPQFRRWAAVKPGRFIMHITSLHLFRNDFATAFA